MTNPLPHLFHSLRLGLVALASYFVVPLGFVGTEVLSLQGAEPKGIPFDQFGAEAHKQYSGGGISIIPFEDGARLNAAMQDLQAEATPEGLWLTSTSDEDAGTPNRFRVKAMAVNREVGKDAAVSDGLRPTGQVRATKGVALFIRPGVIEEYTVNNDGVRQDFVLPQRPPGTGKLSVDLEISGARAELSAYGAKITVSATGRELAYSRLKVTDATGKELTAHMELTAPDKLRVVVTDATAMYPRPLDPTFSDADWVSMGGMAGTNGWVYAIAADALGNVYVGGYFTQAGGGAANYIARWDGSGWTPLGAGLNGSVFALVASGGDLYVGGDFTTAGGVSANRIAKWNDAGWSGLGTGMNDSVIALAMIGSDLYAGGRFSTAGGVHTGEIAKWDGTEWSSLGAGTSSEVHALASADGVLYVGGGFLAAGGEDVKEALNK